MSWKTRCIAAAAAALTLFTAVAPAHAELQEYLLPDGFNSQHVTGANPLPVSTVPNATVTGSAASATTLSNFPAATLGASSVTFHWTTAGAGNVATYEGSNDGINWAGITCQSSAAAGLASALTTVFSVAVASPITCSTGGFSQVRVRISTYVSGTPAVVAQFSSLQAIITAVIQNNVTMLGAQQPGVSTSTVGFMTGGFDGTNYRNFKTDVTGDLGVVGWLTGGSLASASIPGFNIELYDGTNYRMAASDPSGAAITSPWAATANRWNFAAASGGIVNTTTAVTIKAAAGASIRNYVNSCQVSHDALGAATELVVRDGASGTVIERMRLQTAAQEGITWNFDSPLKGTANTLMEVAAITAVTGGIYVNCQGFAGS